MNESNRSTMKALASTVQTGETFAFVQVGPFAALPQFTFQATEKSLVIEGKVFLKDLLHLTSAEISMNTLLPKKSIPFYHKHQRNEEVYIFVRGCGEFQVDDRVFPITEGTVVRVDPDGERCLRNTSATEPLIWIVVQSQAGSYDDHTIADGVGVEKRVSWVGKVRL